MVLHSWYCNLFSPLKFSLTIEKAGKVFGWNIMQMNSVGNCLSWSSFIIVKHKLVFTLEFGLEKRSQVASLNFLIVNFSKNNDSVIKTLKSASYRHFYFSLQKQSTSNNRALNTRGSLASEIFPFAIIYPKMFFLRNTDVFTTR